MSSATLSTAVAAHPPARPSVEPGSVGRRPRRRTTTAARPRLESSRDAKQRAAAILEVLAGGRSPTAAAEALGVSLTHYYHLEEKALLGLVAACEPQPRGRSEDPARRLAVLERECQRWQRECARQQALVRAAQRSIGLAAPERKEDAARFGLTSDRSLAIFCSCLGVRAKLLAAASTMSSIGPWRACHYLRNPPIMRPFCACWPKPSSNSPCASWPLF